MTSIQMYLKINDKYKILIIDKFIHKADRGVTLRLKGAKKDTTLLNC